MGGGNSLLTAFGTWRGPWIPLKSVHLAMPGRGKVAKASRNPSCDVVM